MKPIIASILFLIDHPNNRVLMGRKTRKVGVGTYTGPGGKMEPEDTDIVATAIRETFDECGIVVTRDNLEKHAVIVFQNVDEQGVVQSAFDVHVFVANTWSGELVNSDEMQDLHWHPIEKILELPMMASDLLWVPQILEYGSKFMGIITMKDNQTKLVDINLRSVTTLS